MSEVEGGGIALDTHELGHGRRVEGAIGLAPEVIDRGRWGGTVAPVAAKQGAGDADLCQLSYGRADAAVA